MINAAEIPAVGDQKTFIPSAYLGDNGSEAAKKRIDQTTVTGTVTMINRAHRWYRVTYETDFNGTQHECFKF